MSSSKGPYPVKRGPSSRSGSSPWKTSARSGAGWSNSGMGRQGKAKTIIFLLMKMSYYKLNA